jgi:hypothetical protein
MLRETMITALQRRVMYVTFTKVDGTERKMLCTLNDQYLPQRSDTVSERKRTDEVVSVYDLEKDDWRSFRVSSVSKFEEGV